MAPIPSPSAYYYDQAHMIVSLIILSFSHTLISTCATIMGYRSAASSPDSSRHNGSPDRMRIESILNDPDDKVKTDALNIENDEDTDVTYIGTDDDMTPDRFIEYAGKDTGAIMDRVRRRSTRLPRPACKKYNPEEADFIWYFRTDLECCWDVVEREFYRQFGAQRKKPGLQCKFYRWLEIEGVEKVREQAKTGHRRGGPQVGKFGLVQRTTRRFPWM